MVGLKSQLVSLKEKSNLFPTKSRPFYLLKTETQLGDELEAGRVSSLTSKFDTLVISLKEMKQQVTHRLGDVSVTQMLHTLVKEK